MKISVIGNGNVGMAVFNELRQLRELEEIHLAARNLTRIQAEVEDYEDARILAPRLQPRLSFGPFFTVSSCDILIYAAGTAQKPGQTRTELFQSNRQIAEDIFRKIGPLAPETILLCLTNPVDAMTFILKQITGLPHNQVIGSGTLLDTARMQKLLSRFFDLSHHSIDAYVLGEHGDTSFIPWNAVRIAGSPIQDYFRLSLGVQAPIQYEGIIQNVHESAYRLIDQKGSTAYGIAVAAVRIVEAIVKDTREILPVTVFPEGRCGLTDCALSLPAVLTRQGVREILELPLSPAERQQLKTSANAIKSLLQ